MMTRIGGSWVHEYAALSTDTKFTNVTNPQLNIPNGSQCIEMDTCAVFMYDLDHETWLPLTVG